MGVVFKHALRNYLNALASHRAPYTLIYYQIT